MGNHQLSIIVMPGDWGDASIVDIQVLLDVTAKELTDHVTDLPMREVKIIRGFGSPMARTDRPADDIRLIELTVEGTYWSRFIYQFAHELCHHLCNSELYFPTVEERWFEETLCDVASLFSLHQSSNRWQHSPPYSHWSPYADRIRDYMREYTNRIQQSSPTDFSNWYRVHRDCLRNNPCLLDAEGHRSLNEVVALHLLPVFLNDPSKWGAIRFLNLQGRKAKPSFEAYLTDWLHDTPVHHQSIIFEIADLFELTLPV